MTRDQKALLDALRGQLAFIESGGYRSPVDAPWRAKFMFEDSPTCLNRDPIQPRKPCSECLLIGFVPEEQSKKRVPCRYIPLNKLGETVDSLYRTGTQEELEVAVVAWLKTTIGRLQREAQEATLQTPEIHVKGRVVSFD